ncbi:sugar-binding transcriptional regulator [Chelativorans sp. M5D2P16]|uniref:sugar-binding transcriptional regulator n=1 Tax=Chelativorans sp. M5D2P16 TaxID=3095678 RepID=UPI002ACA06B6|nr:sugar-binding transcriptional regulator [Chelativorans sp. M5D2P16]MDZ5700133.1 sugar-binding transcriptional regulator [Chelativorans sp. M5D2P16]
MEERSKRREAGETARKREPPQQREMVEGLSDDWPEQLAVRTAWCYYALNMTQQEVAARLGITRVRVIRLLGEARRRGVVKISIESKLADNVELEHRLMERFGLDFAEVVLGMTDDETELAEILGAAASAGISRQLQDGVTLGVGWGVTLKAFAEALPERPLKNAAVVSLLGSLTRRSSIATFEATTTISARLHAECFYVPGPILCDSRESRDTLMAQPMMQDVLDRARSSDMAVVSVGGLDSGTIRRTRFVSERDFADVREAGAVGNFLGYYIDENAQVIDHRVNDRVIGLRPEFLTAIPRRIMISGGRQKVAALAAILKKGLLTGIVTDQQTAHALLEHH